MIDTSAINAIKEFDARHGNDFVVVDGWVLYPDGSKRENVPYGASIDGDRLSPESRHAAIVFFYQEKLALSVAAFKSLKDRLTIACNSNLRQQYCNPAPTQENLAELVELQRKVKHYQDKLKEVQAVVTGQKTPKQIELEKRSEINRQKNSEVLEQIENIEV